MRVLLTNYLRNSSTPVDINSLDGGPIASARLWFDEWVGVGASSLDDVVIESLRPGVYRCMAAEAPATIYMKVHDAWGRTDRGEALFPADVTAGVVYIVRNPLDMASSCAHHWGVDMDTSVTHLCDPEHAIARSLGGLSDQLRQRLLCWSGHVHSWLDAANLPVHVVRYEDLLVTPEATFGGVIRFCGLPFDESRVSRAVAFSDFSELQRQERETGFRERSLRAPGPFFRRGQAGKWREELTEELSRRLMAAHSGMMARFGYTADNGGDNDGT